MSGPEDNPRDNEQREFSNDLSNAETERLAFLIEELGEALQCAGKIIRHGYESYNPVVNTGMTNRRELERELGDITAAITMMVNSRDVSSSGIDIRSKDKLHTVKRWLHHQSDE